MADARRQAVERLEDMRNVMAGEMEVAMAALPARCDEAAALELRQMPARRRGGDTGFVGKLARRQRLPTHQG
jgi:hypothetical protein